MTDLILHICCALREADYIVITGTVVERVRTHIGSNTPFYTMFIYQPMFSFVLHLPA